MARQPRSPGGGDNGGRIPAGAGLGPTLPPGGLPNWGRFDVIGVTGLRRYGEISRIYEEWLPELQGDLAQKVYREMYEQDPIIGATWFAIEMLCRKVSWTNSPADGSNQAKQIAEFFDQQMNDMSASWGDTLSEILTFGPYGWSLMEKCFKQRRGPNADPTMKSKFNDGKVAWRKLEIRSQDTRFMWMFEPSPDTGLLGMQQLAPPHFVMTPIPLSKCLLFRTKARKGNPEGVSVLRNAFRPWAFKKRIENIEGIGVERDLAGLPVGYAPPEIFSNDATPEQQALFSTMKKLITGIKRDENEGILWPLAYDEEGHLLYDLKLLSTGGQRQFDTNEVIVRYETRMAMTVLADFLLLGHAQVGSFALVDNRSDMFAEAIGSWLDGVGRVVTEHGYPELMQMNNWPEELTPSLEHGKVNSVDLKELGAYIQALAASGAPIWPNDDLMTYVFEAAGLPVPESGFDTADDMNQARQMMWTPELTPGETYPAETDLKVNTPPATAVVGGAPAGTAPAVGVAAATVPGAKGKPRPAQPTAAKVPVAPASRSNGAAPAKTGAP
jgi:hypothetical protein